MSRIVEVIVRSNESSDTNFVQFKSDNPDVIIAYLGLILDTLRVDGGYYNKLFDRCLAMATAFKVHSDPYPDT